MGDMPGWRARGSLSSVRGKGQWVHIGNPRPEAGKHIRLVAGTQVIACSASRCITARERTRALQVRGNEGADGARPGSFVVLYRTPQSDNAVQDIGRQPDAHESGRDNTP